MFEIRNKYWNIGTLDSARVLNKRIGNKLLPHGIAENRTPNPKLFFQFIFFFKLFSETILGVGKVLKKGSNIPLFLKTY